MCSYLAFIAVCTFTSPNALLSVDRTQLFASNFNSFMFYGVSTCMAHKLRHDLPAETRQICSRKLSSALSCVCLLSLVNRGTQHSQSFCTFVPSQSACRCDSLCFCTNFEEYAGGMVLVWQTAAVWCFREHERQLLAVITHKLTHTHTRTAEHFSELRAFMRFHECRFTYAWILNVRLSHATHKRVKLTGNGEQWWAPMFIKIR